jgi:hypothetical protein
MTRFSERIVLLTVEVEGVADPREDDAVGDLGQEVVLEV